MRKHRQINTTAFKKSSWTRYSIAHKLCWYDHKSEGIQSNCFLSRPWIMELKKSQCTAVQHLPFASFLIEAVLPFKGKKGTVHLKKVTNTQIKWRWLHLQRSWNSNWYIHCNLHFRNKLTLYNSDLQYQLYVKTWCNFLTI